MPVQPCTGRRLTKNGVLHQTVNGIPGASGPARVAGTRGEYVHVSSPAASAAVDGPRDPHPTGLIRPRLRAAGRRFRAAPARPGSGCGIFWMRLSRHCWARGDGWHGSGSLPGLEVQQCRSCQAFHCKSLSGSISRFANADLAMLASTCSPRTRDIRPMEGIPAAFAPPGCSFSICCGRGEP